MRRRLATFMAVSMFALALGASPALAADSHGDHHGWLVVARSSTDLTSYPSDALAWLLDCSTAHHASSYTLIRGFEDNVQMYRGAMNSSGIALGPGEGVETWTLRDVLVRSNQTGRVYEAEGSSRIQLTWSAGASLDAGPFTSGRYTQRVTVEGTRDGRSFTQVGTTWPFTMVSDHGTCSNLELGMS